MPLYRFMVQPHLEYGVPSCLLHIKKDIEDPEYTEVSDQRGVVGSHVLTGKI